MKKLRSLHLFLGCIFAPKMLFFVISGLWQTYWAAHLDYRYHGKVLTSLSNLHEGIIIPKEGVGLTTPVLRYFILAMSIGFIFTTVLGVVMALTQGGNRKMALCCLAFGVVFPVSVILIHLYS
jgi:hypothetical protein